MGKVQTCYEFKTNSTVYLTKYIKVLCYFFEYLIRPGIAQNRYLCRECFQYVLL